MNKISEFQGEYRFLSNFYRSAVNINGYSFYTAEAAYQACKTDSNTNKRHLSSIICPVEAKRFGRNMKPIVSDWNQIKDSYMYSVVLNKFSQNVDIKNKLIATENAILEEGNAWNDTYWGICPPNSNIGRNRLGIILMEVRLVLS